MNVPDWMKALGMIPVGKARFSVPRTQIPRARGPSANQQLLLPFDKTTRAVNRGSQRGLLLRLLKMSQGKYGWSPEGPHEFFPPERRPFQVFGTEPRTRKPLTIDASQAEVGVYGKARVYNRKPAMPDLPSRVHSGEVELKGHPTTDDPRELLSTFAHEMQHIDDLFGDKVMTPKGEMPLHRQEARAMLAGVLAEGGLFGLDDPRIKAIKKHTAPYLGTADYSQGAQKVLRLLERLK